MLYVGTQSYSVHASILAKSDVLGSMSLEEAEDGSYSISLPKEDPAQFEKLLTYMYQGTWEPENCGGRGCWGRGPGQVCYCWTNKRYMQLYAIACKYAVHGLAAMVASKLDRKENVLRFCEAFKTAYEMCPGSYHLRSLFRSNLVSVFKSNLRASTVTPTNDSHGNTSIGLCTELAELVSCGGDFAVDLMRAFVAAQEDAYRATLHGSYQDAGNHDDWGCQTVKGGNNWGRANNEGHHQADQDAGDHDNWRCQTAEGGNDWAPANNEGCHETERDAGGWFSTSPVVNDRRRCVETPAPVPATLPIREDMKDIQGRVRNLEDMVSRLQFIAETSVQTQQPSFQQPPNGSALGYIAPGWGPDSSVPAKVSWPLGWD